MDALYLNYLIKSKGITREALAEAMGWSPATCARRMSGTADWTVPELQTLRKLGFTAEELERVFFKD